MNTASIFSAMALSAARGLYAAMLRLYPRDFREAFAQDMRLDFQEALADASSRGVWAALGVCLRELGDYPASVLRLSGSDLIPEVEPFQETCKDVPGTWRAALAAGCPCSSAFYLRQPDLRAGLSRRAPQPGHFLDAGGGDTALRLDGRLAALVSQLDWLLPGAVPGPHRAKRAARRCGVCAGRRLAAAGDHHPAQTGAPGLAERPAGGAAHRPDVGLVAGHGANACWEKRCSLPASGWWSAWR
jgi:hypothetical protein